MIKCMNRKNMNMNQSISLSAAQACSFAGLYWCAYYYYYSAYRYRNG